MKFFIPVLVFVFTVGLYAQPERGMGNRKAKIAEKLNLTVEQEKKIETLRTAHQKQMIDLAADMAKLHLEKKELMNKGSYDRKTLVALEEKIIKQRDIIDLARINHQMDVYEILDAQQKEIWNKKPMNGAMGIHGKRNERMGQMKHHPNGCDGMGPKF